LSAASADNALSLGGVPASEYVTNSSVGSAFIRNGTALQTANLNISGNGYFGGFLGIGTVNPQSPLSVQTGSLSYGFTQTNGTITVGSYIDATGGWLGTRSNHPLNFFTNDGGRQMTLLQNGNLGIGVTNPTAKLEISGTGFGAQQRITDNASGNSLVLQSGSGNGMKVTGYNYNTNAAVPLYLSVDGANTSFGGSITQSRDKGGLVKAMIYVNGDGTILRCYNGTNGSSSGNCGFSVAHDLGSAFAVDFNFQVNDRFLTITVENAAVSNQAGVNYVFGSQNDQIFVYTFQIGAGLSDRPFMVIVY
jgi:hypothetical protein